MKRVFLAVIYDTTGAVVGTFVFAKREMFLKSLEMSFHGANVPKIKEEYVDNHTANWTADGHLLAQLKSVPMTVQPIYFNC